MRTTIASALGIIVAGALASSAFAQGLPPLEQKDRYKVGFSQTESNNPWRIAQTESMKAEAAKLGHQLVYTDAAGSAAKQVADVNSMIAQGVDLIFLAPREEKPLIPAVMAALTSSLGTRAPSTFTAPSSYGSAPNTARTNPLTASGLAAASAGLTITAKP